jgi:hypothetical protein
MAALFLGSSNAADTVKNRPAPAAADALAQDWLPRWEQKITGAMRTRYCDRETGEQLGWLVSPSPHRFVSSQSHPFVSPLRQGLPA